MSLVIDLKAAASAAVDNCNVELRALSTEIWSNPELAYEERGAHKVLTDFLEKKGFTVDRSYTGLETAFRATYGSGKPNVCVICEYDALPGIGHACGHNLIAEAGVAAGLGLKAALECEGAPKGMVTVMGTPAEEGGGGKVQLINNGAFKNIDVAMMVHPFPTTLIRPLYNARKTIRAGYTGVAAHAAAYPWEGVNALDAVVTAYTSVSVLRQQMKPTWRVHSIITKGGAKPNIIPEYAELLTYIRAPNIKELDVLVEKVSNCYEAAAKATGCQVKIEVEEIFYTDVQQNPVLASSFSENYRQLGVEFGDVEEINASTDMGNVSHVVPSLHPNYAVGSGKEVNHSHAFTAVTNTPAAHDNTLLAAKAMAHTAIDVLASEDLLDKVRNQFQKN
jgi:amidohydrolase